MYSAARAAFPDLLDQVAAAIPANLRLATLSVVATQSGDGVGDCGGGPLRVIFGTYAKWAGLALKAICLVLPTLHAFMWLIRAAGKSRAESKALGMPTETPWSPTFAFRGKSKLARWVMFTVCWLQCFFICSHNFDGIQGHMAGFWVMLLLGGLWESLLCTYDIRGQGRQLLYLIIFILL